MAAQRLGGHTSCEMSIQLEADGLCWSLPHVFFFETLDSATTPLCTESLLRSNLLMEHCTRHNSGDGDDCDALHRDHEDVVLQTPSTYYLTPARGNTTKQFC